jgi:hypothetical protein
MIGKFLYGDEDPIMWWVKSLLGLGSTLLVLLFVIHWYLLGAPH